MTLEFAGRTVVGDFVLAVKLSCTGGEPTVLIGANGSGKSSLLRTIAGLNFLADGSLELGESIYDDTRVVLPPERRSVGMVFQNHRLFDHLSVADNIGFGLRSRGVKKSARNATVGRLVDAFELSDLADRSPRTLSGGQRARVALARAIAPNPEVLLLDEPFAAIDVESHGELRKAISELIDPTAIVIFVTHDPVEARILATQLVVLEKGKIVQSGSPAEVAASPTSSFAAELLGTNLLAGTSDGTLVKLASGATLISASPANGQVHLTFPPTALTLHRTRPSGSARNVWEADVTEIIDQGDRLRIVLGGPLDATAVITPGAEAELELRPGTSCWASLKATEITVVTA
ncbi:MAG: ABC transporter ATP-binding protein [Acidimicrobiales bacterium]